MTVFRSAPWSALVICELRNLPILPVDPENEIEAANLALRLASIVADQFCQAIV